MKSLFERVRDELREVRFDHYIKGTMRHNMSEQDATKMYEDGIRRDLENLEYVKERMKKGISLEKAVEELSKDQEFYIKFLEDNKSAFIPHIHVEGETMEWYGLDIFDFANDDIRNNPDVIKAVIKNNKYGNDLVFAGEKILNDKGIVKMAVIAQKDNFRYASEELRGDLEFLKELYEEEPYLSKTIMKYTSEEIRNNKEFVRLVAKADIRVLAYIGDELKNDFEFALELVREDPDAITYMSEEVKNEKQIVLEAVRGDGRIIEKLSDELKADKDIQIEAVKTYGYALQYADEELRSNPQVVLDAVKSNGNALRYASDELKADEDVVLAAVNSEGNALRYASKELRCDYNVVMKAVKQNGYALKYASKELRGNKEIVQEAVRESDYEEDVVVLYYANEELRNDKDIILTAIEADPNSIYLVDPEIRDNPEFMKDAIKTEPYILMIEELKASHDKDMLLLAIDVLKERQEKDTEIQRGINLIIESYETRIEEIQRQEKKNQMTRLEALRNDKQYNKQRLEEANVLLEQYAKLKEDNERDER